MTAEWSAVEWTDEDENDLTCDCNCRDMHESLITGRGFLFGLAVSVAIWVAAGYGVYCIVQAVTS